MRSVPGWQKKPQIKERRLPPQTGEEETDDEGPPGCHSRWHKSSTWGGGSEAAIRDGLSPLPETVSMRDGTNTCAALAQPRPQPQEGPSTSGHVESASPRRQAVADLFTSTRGRGTTTRGISQDSPRRARTGAAARVEAVPTAVVAVEAGKDTGSLEHRSRSGSSPWSSSGHSSGRRRAKKRRRQSPDSGQALLSRVKDLLGQLLQKPGQPDPEQQVTPSIPQQPPPLPAPVTDHHAPEEAQGDPWDDASSRADDALTTAVLCRVLGFEEKVDARAQEGPASKLSLNVAAQ
ncbi:hypothetical protein BSL78_04062 [Apostichopus japonicus]|uniref:Uncharacterized protein n=1 Tax=Stichopus japonicus TaxID=307972 RepID=A0A2G8LFL0_STIJA|nr:hypothetical protein BSL78_04062 [Apostichopus japonicus]